MNVAIVLWTYAAAVAATGGLTLRHTGWVDRAPRLAIATWQALSASVVLAVALGGLALVVPTAVVSSSLAGLVEACAMALRAQYATPGGAALATAGLALALGVLSRWLYCWLSELSRNTRVRRRHHEVLSMVGRAGPQAGVTLLEHDVPVVYCVAGRPHRIVLTTAAGDALDEAQLAAVLAHERAHLRGRHDLAVGAAVALARAFPWPRVFRDARDEVTRLVELLADDHATRSANRLSLAEAMLTLAAPAPAGALAAGGSTAAGRVRRLIDGHRPLAAWAKTLGLTAAMTLAAAPLFMLATPAATAGPDCCVDGPPPALAAEECLAVGRHDDCTSMSHAAS